MSYRFILNYIKYVTIMEQPLEIMTHQINYMLLPRLFIICVSKITNDDNIIQFPNSKTSGVSSIQSNSIPRSSLLLVIQQ